MYETRRTPFQTRRTGLLNFRNMIDDSTLNMRHSIYAIVVDNIERKKTPRYIYVFNNTNNSLFKTHNNVV